MTPDAFQQLWDRVAPAAPPIPHFFKWQFSKRWFRIHSLPGSKRYADTEIEWTILLDRQRTILADLFGKTTQMILVTGYYDNANSYSLNRFIKQNLALYDLKFTRLKKIDLYELEPDAYSAGMFYYPIFTELTTDAPQIELILRAVANDESRAFFINPVSKSIVAPYDGGVDIILPDIITRNRYKAKYQDWLSEHVSGL